jgi:hypothetical protein
MRRSEVRKTLDSRSSARARRAKRLGLDKSPDVPVEKIVSELHKPVKKKVKKKVSKKTKPTSGKKE